jgi:hypothetical protein
MLSYPQQRTGFSYGVTIMERIKSSNDGGKNDVALFFSNLFKNLLKKSKTQGSSKVIKTLIHSTFGITDIGKAIRF